ncbi:hypothetical protein [Haladaptatus halobius]|uniref:hypothetical protein n=1 Tax=Haladaptatus halobius TaxID=2884875 RepID=UPI001D0B9793|nr:hypothetical protein [Haladaptatus halobius]
MSEPDASIHGLHGRRFRLSVASSSALTMSSAAESQMKQWFAAAARARPFVLVSRKLSKK